MRENETSILFYEGLPSKEKLEEWTKDGEDLLLILDDLVYRVIQSFDYMELFSIYVHHLKISVIFISQNLFPQGKYSRVISLNCQYLVLFKNPRDNFQIRYLATQLYPRNTSYFIDAYEKATQKPYSYLLVDLSVSGNRDYALRGDIFPNDLLTVYIKKSNEHPSTTKLSFSEFACHCSAQTTQSIIGVQQSSTDQDTLGSDL